jgi:hypothetical protein
VSSVFGFVSDFFARGQRPISRGQDSFNVSRPRPAAVELRLGSDVNVRPCGNGSQVFFQVESSIRPKRATASLAASVDQTEARNGPTRQI